MDAVVGESYIEPAPMRLMIEQPKSVNEGESVENPKGERAPVQRLVIRHYAFSSVTFHGTWRESSSCRISEVSSDNCLTLSS